MSSIKISTELLKKATGDAFKGSGRSSIIPFSQSIGIEAKNKDLTLTTTSGSFNLYIKIPNSVQEGVSFYTAVDSELFYKLVSKQTTKELELVVDSKYLLIKGNGEYKLAVQTDVEDAGIDGAIRVPEIKIGQATTDLEISKKDIDKVLKYNKISVGKSFNEPILISHYVKDGKVVTFNSKILTVTETGINLNGVLLPANLVGLLEIIKDEKIKVLSDNNKIVFETPNVKIIGSLMENADKYPYNELTSLISSDEFNYRGELKVSKTQLNSVLDRVSLFIDETGLVKFLVTDKSLLISSTDGSGYEKIDVLGEVKERLDSTISLNSLNSILSTLSGEEVIIKYSQIGILIEENKASLVTSFNVEDDYTEQEAATQEQVEDVDGELDNPLE